MCGRFAKYAAPDERAAMRAEDWRSIKEVWRPDKPVSQRDAGGGGGKDDDRPRGGGESDGQGRRQGPRDRWNIAPSQEIEVIRKNPTTGELQTDMLVWGLVPRWTKSLQETRKPINARAETVRTSGMFKDCFERRRALVPMSVFYEWAGAKAPKQPFAIGRPDGGDMRAAAIWDGWRAPDGSILRTVAIITTEANAMMAPIHKRMPVLIQDGDVDLWFGNDVDAAEALLVPPPDDYLRAWPVSTQVNDVRKDGPDLLDPL